MYSETRFNYAKFCLTAAYLHSPTDAIQQVEVSFLRSLLSAAAQREQVMPDDVYRAVESSGVFNLNLSDDEKDKIIADLCNIGDNYVGALSRQQAAELRNLRKLCILAAERGDQDALAQIAELI